ncbi:hypothetical protein ACFOON_12275 [Novosphingobium piscinae]|nr:hypothetical protein [Novosphingobium piscinae]
MLRFNTLLDSAIAISIATMLAFNVFVLVQQLYTASGGTIA